MRLIKWNRNNEHLNNGNYKHFIFFYYRLSPSIKVTFFNFWISLYVRWLREISLLNNEHGWYENTSFCHRAITIEINISQVTPGLTFVKILILFTGNMMAKVSTTPIEHCCLHCRWIIVERLINIHKANKSICLCPALKWQKPNMKIRWWNFEKFSQFACSRLRMRTQDKKVY